MSSREGKYVNVKMPTGALSQVAKSVKVGEDVTEVVESMWLTLIKAEGIGLAANQVGLLQRIIVVNVKGFSTEIINPVITKWSGNTKLSRESCLSFPGKIVKVKRDACVTLEGFDRNWNPITKRCRALTAFCVQHEIDHLNGVTI